MMDGYIQMGWFRYTYRNGIKKESNHGYGYTCTMDKVI